MTVQVLLDPRSAPVHGVTPGLGTVVSQVLNVFFERPSTMSSRRAGPVLSRIGVRSMMTVTHLSRRLGVAPHTLVDAEDPGDVEAEPTAR